MATFLNAAREVKSCEKADILTLTFLHTFLIFLKIDQGVHTISLNCRHFTISINNIYEYTYMSMSVHKNACKSSNFFSYGFTSQGRTPVNVLNAAQTGMFGMRTADLHSITLGRTLKKIEIMLYSDTTPLY